MTPNRVISPNRSASCVTVCPDAVVYAVDKKVFETDLDYCKGCGICAQECPVGDIIMVPEAQQHA